MKQILYALILTFSVSGMADSQETEYLGQFCITHYCSCRICNGKWTGYSTAADTDYVEGRTVAVYKPQIPLGSEILIDGHVYTAEDSDPASNKTVLIFMYPVIRKHWIQGFIIPMCI